MDCLAFRKVHILRPFALPTSAARTGQSDGISVAIDCLRLRKHSSTLSSLALFRSNWPSRFCSPCVNPENVQSLRRRQVIPKTKSFCYRSNSVIASKANDSSSAMDGSDSQGLQLLKGLLGPPETLKGRIAALWGSGAILGPLLDGRHSHHNVLHYKDPIVLHLGSLFQLETCWWVPILFGGAAVILGIGHPALDSVASNTRDSLEVNSPESNLSRKSPVSLLLGGEPTGGYAPSWSFVLISIALFAWQYDLSGLLAEKASEGVVSWLTLNLVLAGTAVAHWATFDRTRQGFFWAALTALVGPLVEIGLIEGLHLYHYTHPDIFGIPLWIPWVYWCGAPAVGNLGRRINKNLR